MAPEDFLLPASVSFCMMANFLAAVLPRMTPALAEARAPRRVMVWNFIVDDDDLGGCFCLWMLLMLVQLAGVMSGSEQFMMAKKVKILFDRQIESRHSLNFCTNSYCTKLTRL